MPARTLDDLWQKADRRPGGFDLLRTVFAVAVILFHTLTVCYGRQAEMALWLGAWRPVVYFIIPAFFALSGFLVAGSLERNDLFTFFSLRAIRIFPALAVEVILSAFLIGMIFTTFTFKDYFTDKKFWLYLLNIGGFIHYSLPGVFLGLPTPDSVNLQLWTVPFELDCYLVLGGMAYVGVGKNWKLSALALALIYIAIPAYKGLRGTLPGLDVGPPGALAVLCFLFGVALYFLRARVSHSWMLCLASVAGWSVLIYWPVGIFLAAPFIAYTTIYLGLVPLRSRALSTVSNYSYGLYLYGFPMQQVVASLWVHQRVWYVNFALSLGLAFAMAMLSWHVVEAPIMKNRSSIIRWLRKMFRVMPT